MADISSPVLQQSEANSQPHSPTEIVETDHGKGKEQALELHEVVELQTFSDKKAWIEEKIKFLEALPPIDVFVGLDSIKVSAEEVPGLPNRQELQQMVAEHDAIEKETEIFDTGDLTKLRQLTKAATQRNLSPADTDVIELTLTTIYELDKLLHLLRDRSEHLEMMSIRLSWEENRQSSWKERRQIIEDLHGFAVSRARWNPSIYESASKQEDASPPIMSSRRGSVASQASTGSDSLNGVMAPSFSRTARFKLAELLSRDAAQFSGRVTSLRHGKVTAAGRALDKLIDHSRKPVPEDFLDEQDRLEEKCITELESIGKFTMALVMQWRKADEIHVETMKDHITASNLLEEIETAKLYHPTSRQSASFTSRIDTVLKRLAVRGDPASTASLFPRPEHLLFPDQKEANLALVQRLSDDLSEASKLARRVERITKEYRTRYEAVKKVEMLLQAIKDVTETLTAINKRFQEGVPGGDGDGSPPNLMLESALEPVAHGVFLALLPKLLEDTMLALDTSDRQLAGAPVILAGIEFPGVDHAFKENAATVVHQLSTLREETVILRDTLSKRVGRLKEARRISAAMDSQLVLLKSARLEIARAMDLERWRQQSGGTGTPPTPESPSSKLTIPGPLLNFEDQLSIVRRTLQVDINAPLDRLCIALEPPMQDCLRHRFSILQTSLDDSDSMLRLLGLIRSQSSAMTSLRDDFRNILVRVENLNVQLSSSIANTLAAPDSAGPSGVPICSVADLEAAKSEVKTFINNIQTRTSFIAAHGPIRGGPMKSPSLPRSPHSPSPSLSTSHFAQLELWAEMPFDLATVDSAVRADSNSYAMRLNGSLETLLQTKTHLDMVSLVVQVDSRLSIACQEVDRLANELATQRERFSRIDRQTSGSVDQLEKVLNDLVLVHTNRPGVARSLTPIRDLLRQMDDLSKTLPVSVRRSLYDTRTSSTDDAELRLHTWDNDLTSLKREVTHALESDRLFQQELMLEAERIERERLAEEQMQRDLAAKVAAEELMELEKQRLEAEKAEEESEKKRAAEAERRRLEEEERAAAELRATVEKERREREEEDFRNREQARLEMEQKLRDAEAQLENERRLRAENERNASELAKKQQMTIPESTRSQAQLERVASEEVHEEQSKPLQSQPEEGGKNGVEEERRVDDGGVETEWKKEQLRPTQADDIFSSVLSAKESQIQAQILGLRRRLKSLGIRESVRPSTTSSELPTEAKLDKISEELLAISTDVLKLPAKTGNNVLDAELGSLRAEIEELSGLLIRMENLVDMGKAIQACDAALSDLLEHIDSYPKLPQGVLSSLHRDNPSLSPEEQLSGRLTFTREAVEAMTNRLSHIEGDRRASSEHSRIHQTWIELNDMALDRLAGSHSRPGSSISGTDPNSSRHSSTSVQTTASTRTRGSKKNGSYSHLSVSSVSSMPSKGKMLAPPAQIHSPRQFRRVTSATSETPSRSASRQSSISSVRSVSNPLSNLFGSTFASRQRTISLSTTASSSSPSSNRRISLAPPSRARLDSTSRRAMSPSELSQSSTGHSYTHRATSRSSINTSSWSRAPRDSISSILPRNATPQHKKTAPPPRKKYIADPKSKLDVAVGDVVNQLPVGINIEGITESWKDQSGKYWIGNQDPKLCFCRILRSQTVMVRVGGGWTELSRFIKDHFAESFRMLAPESPPANREEKWISSASLLEAKATDTPPRTPEPTVPFVPSFSLMTPEAQSPKSLKSSPSTKGSPLTPLQFMRRAEPETLSLLRPATPSKTPSRAQVPPTTPGRISAWRY